MIKLILGDSLDILPMLDSEIAQTCVTSPPYYGLRDYENDMQMGLEYSPEAYVANLVSIFSQIRRILKQDGTLWLNLGDTYNGNKKGNTNGTYGKGKEVDESKVYAKTDSFSKKLWTGAKEKDLIGIPWMVAFALRNGGWYLRQDIIWAKPNPMTESVKDRCTKSHEHIFLFAKSKNYLFNHEAMLEPSLKDGKYPFRNKRDVWTAPTASYKEAHFATFPPALIEPCILAGSNKGDTVIDPFSGAGTTGLVSNNNERNYIGIDVNEKYLQMSYKRITNGR